MRRKNATRADQKTIGARQILCVLCSRLAQVWADAFFAVAIDVSASAPRKIWKVSSAAPHVAVIRTMLANSCGDESACDNAAEQSTDAPAWTARQSDGARRSNCRIEDRRGHRAGIWQDRHQHSGANDGSDRRSSAYHVELLEMQHGSVLKSFRKRMPVRSHSTFGAAGRDDV